MFVAATTQCYPDLSLDQAIEKLAHLEFSHIDIHVSEDSKHLKPSQIADDLQFALDTCLNTQRLVVTGLSLDIPGDEEQSTRTFTKCCELAKAAKIVTLTVESGEQGTPFNEEVERYKSLVKIAEKHGVRVAMRTREGNLSSDPDTVGVICGHVKGLGLSLDPSHYMLGNPETTAYDKLMKYVHNVYLRDSTGEQLQVRVGQGVVDYGRIISQLRSVNYQRALCVDIQPSDDPEIDHDGELRKLRLLLESLVLV